MWQGEEGSWIKQKEKFHLTASSRTPSADPVGCYAAMTVLKLGDIIRLAYNHSNNIKPDL